MTIIDNSKFCSTSSINLVKNSDEDNFSNFERLPSDIAEQIVFQLSIQTINSLSLTSKSCYHLTRSDSLWRKICKSLISNWIYSPSPLKFSQDPQQQTEKEQVDWTLDFKSWLNSSFDQIKIVNWFQLATGFILPNLQYFGWHASNRNSLGRLILVTFDSEKCEIVGEEIKAINTFDITHYQQDYKNENLPKTRPAHPAHATRLSPRMDVYRLAIDAESPYAGYSINLFKPAYVSVPYFRLKPSFSSSYTSPLKLSPSVDSLATLKSSSVDFLSPETIETLRLPQSRLDLPICSLHSHPATSSEKDLITTFKLSISCTPKFTTAIPVSNHPSIRWQSTPTHRPTLSATIMHNGRRYITRSSEGTGEEAMKSKDEDERFFPILGSNVSQNGLQGLWVGYYGFHHGVEFGHLSINPVLNEPDLLQITFVKITGDRNVPSGIVSWKTFINRKKDSSGKIKGVVDLDWMERLDSGQVEPSEWSLGRVKGQGRVANVNYENPVWIKTSISFIEDNKEGKEEKEEEEEWNGSNVFSIRVVWHELGHVSSFYKV